MIQIIDDFLPLHEWMALDHIINGDLMPWYWNNTITYKTFQNEPGQFTHSFFMPNEGIVTDHWNVVKPILDRIATDVEGHPAGKRVYQTLRVKANLNFRTDKQMQLGEYHSDYPAIHNATTAIFYCNTNNGYTKFEENEQEVQSKANRLVIFPVGLKHVGYSATDTKRRVLINFNYLMY